jgi:hypothetical protein
MAEKFIASGYTKVPGAQSEHNEMVVEAELQEFIAGVSKEAIVHIRVGVAEALAAGSIDNLCENSASLTLDQARRLAESILLQVSSSEETLDPS